MRAPTRRLCTLGALGATAALWTGCEGRKQTEYVAGISTQVTVPRDLKAIRVDVSVGGVVGFCRGYRVYDGRVQLPRSLGAFPVSGSPGTDPVTITVTGLTKEYSETQGNPVFDNCTAIAPVVGDADQGTRIIRRSRQPYVAERILFLPMPLKYSCFDVADPRCNEEGKTCKAGRCVDASTDPTRLIAFSPDVLDGTGSTCFSASSCFAGALPAKLINADDCTYAPAVANTGEGLNVEITYDGGLIREVLDKDDTEGFFIPDASNPQQFRLAPGLCDLVKGYGPASPEHPEGPPTAHRITAVRVSGACQAKRPTQPLCAVDQLAAMGADAAGRPLTENTPPDACKSQELQPPRAALVVVADSTQNSGAFYTSTSTGLLGLSLTDPAFDRTQFALSFFPGAGECGIPKSFSTAVALTSARAAKPALITQFEKQATALSPLDAPVLLDGALRDAYELLRSPEYATFYKRAVLVIGNRGFGQAACGQTPVERAAAAYATSAIDTYALSLSANSNASGDTTAIADFDALAAAGGTSPAYDARTDKTVAARAFSRIVSDIATCVYDTTDPRTRPDDNSVLTYTDPTSPQATTTTLAFNPACTTSNSAGIGFGHDPSNVNRIVLCQSSCEAFREVLKKSAAFAAQTQQPALAVPMFAHRKGCEPRTAVPR